MAVLAEIGEDTRFLALLFEALERALKVLVVMNYYFRQNLLPPFMANRVAGIGQTYKLRRLNGLGQANHVLRRVRSSACVWPAPERHRRRCGGRGPLRRYARLVGAPSCAPSLCSVAGLLLALALESDYVDPHPPPHQDLSEAMLPIVALAARNGSLA